MKKTYYFKAIGKKHSVRMHLLQIEDDGAWLMENTSYKGITYRVEHPSDELVEETKDE